MYVGYDVIEEYEYDDVGRIIRKTTRRTSPLPKNPYQPYVPYEIYRPNPWA